MDGRTKLIIAAAAIGALIAAATYSHYSRQDTLAAGLAFGNSILDIQDDLKAAQNGLALRLNAWEQGGIGDDDLLEYYPGHLERLDSVIARYDRLEPPPGFGAAVSLFKLSAESQRQSDAEFEAWVRGGDPAAKSRSGKLLQDAFEYESEALAAFNDAKRGRAG